MSFRTLLATLSSLSFFAVCLLAMPRDVQAADPGTPAAPSPPASGAAAAGGNGSETENAFLRQFSIGVGSMNLKRDEIKKASVAGGVVRVDESSRYRNAFWLQTNWSLKNSVYFKGGPAVRPGVWAGLEMGSDNKLANGIAAGFQLSFIQLTNGADGKKGTTALNIGYGWYRSSMQVLADPLEAGKALPAGLESVAYRQQSVNGSMWMLSLNVASF